MAGHSKFANIKHRKAAQDTKRAKVFTRVIKEIVVAAKGNPDESSNPSLRTAIIAAKAVNMPKDRITNAINKASNAGEGENYENVRYEAYGPGGTAFVVECLTDNRNRTASSVRSTFTKFGGNLAESGSVAFMFNHSGVIRYESPDISEEEIFEVGVELGAEAVESEEGVHLVTTEVENFAAVRDGLMEKFGDPAGVGLEWIAKDDLEIDAEKKETLQKLIDVLEEDDDVQDIYTNAELY
jgi:YebC/PmpR family DNA-binding regulatory protein